MNQSVPDFHEMEDDYSIPITSGSSKPKNSTSGEEGIIELMWQNGQVMMQNQRQSKKSAFGGGGGGGGGEVVIPSERRFLLGGEEQQHLFMQEDEMAAWLQYSLDDSSFDRDLYADLLYSAPPPPAPIATIVQPRVIAEIRPPPVPPRPSVSPTVTKPDTAPRLQNFVHFSNLPAKPRTKAINQSPVTTARESTSRPQVDVETGTATAGGTSATAGELGAGTCELSVTSSTGGSRASFTANGEPQQTSPLAAAEDRKRKARETGDNEYQSEDIELEAAEAKKQARGSTSTKRSRAAEVHNLSERRRRDRINEKMLELQELVPRCNKSDKASMLDEVIEYLKSLQMQVQMMSMVCPMVPMMYPGMQQYMPAMGLGMGMNRPMAPYPSMLPSSSMLNPAHMCPRFPMPAPFHMPQAHVHDPSIIHASNHTELLPYFVDPYQQFIGMHHGQLPLPQNQAVSQPRGNEPSISKELDNPDNQQFI